MERDRAKTRDAGVLVHRVRGVGQKMERLVPEQAARGDAAMSKITSLICLAVVVLVLGSVTQVCGAADEGDVSIHMVDWKSPPHMALRTLVTPRGAPDKPIVDLPGTAFRVYADGNPVSDIKVLGPHQRQKPATIVIALDVGPGVKAPELDEAKTACSELINRLGTGPNYIVFEFSETCRQIAGTNDGADVVESRIRSLEARGEKRYLWDATWSAIDAAISPEILGNRDPVLLLLCGGVNHAGGRHNLEECIDKASYYVPIYSVSMDRQAHQEEGISLQRLSEGTGGRYFRSDDPNDMRRSLASIANFISKSYNIAFHCPYNLSETAARAEKLLTVQVLHDQVQGRGDLRLSVPGYVVREWAAEARRRFDAAQRLERESNDWTKIREAYRHAAILLQLWSAGPLSDLAKQANNKVAEGDERLCEQDASNQVGTARQRLDDKEYESAIREAEKVNEKVKPYEGKGRYPQEGWPERLKKEADNIIAQANRAMTRIKELERNIEDSLRDKNFEQADKALDELSDLVRKDSPEFEKRVKQVNAAESAEKACEKKASGHLNAAGACLSQKDFEGAIGEAEQVEPVSKAYESKSHYPPGWSEKYVNEANRLIGDAQEKMQKRDDLRSRVDAPFQARNFEVAEPLIVQLLGLLKKDSAVFDKWQSNLLVIKDSRSKADAAYDEAARKEKERPTELKGIRDAYKEAAELLEPWPSDKRLIVARNKVAEYEERMCEQTVAGHLSSAQGCLNQKEYDLAIEEAQKAKDAKKPYEGKGHYPEQSWPERCNEKADEIIARTNNAKERIVELHQQIESAWQKEDFVSAKPMVEELKSLVREGSVDFVEAEAKLTKIKEIEDRVQAVNDVPYVAAKEGRPFRGLMVPDRTQFTVVGGRATASLTIREEDGSGEPLLYGLSKKHFTLSANKTAIREFSIEPQLATDIAPVPKGLLIVCVIDASGSIAEQELSNAVTLLAELAENIPKDDTVALCVVSDGKRDTFLGTESVVSALNAMPEPKGETPLMDALSYCMDQYGSRQAYRKALLVFSDAEDNVGKALPADIVAKARLHEMSISFVRMGESTNERVVGFLCGGTDGCDIKVPDRAHLVAFYQDLAKSRAGTQNQMKGLNLGSYVLAFPPPGKRDVRVAVDYFGFHREIGLEEATGRNDRDMKLLLFALVGSAGGSVLGLLMALVADRRGKTRGRRRAPFLILILLVWIVLGALGGVLLHELGQLTQGGSFLQ